jgi:hypothetical protein
LEKNERETRKTQPAFATTARLAPKRPQSPMNCSTQIADWAKMSELGVTPMRPAFLFAAITLILVCAGAADALAQSSGKKVIHAFTALEKNRKPTTTFSSDALRIYAFWKGESLAVGDKIQSVWIAEDIGDAAPKDSKILEGETKVFKSDDEGSFSLSRPRGGVWPVGKYRVEIYVNEGLADLVKFTITPGVKIETH